MAKTYTISELSKYFDITPRTIRFYEDQGLIQPQRVKSNRIYNERDFVRLKLILRGKRIGFSIAEIKETMKLYDSQPNERVQIEYVLSTISKHREALIQRKVDIDTVLEDMDEVYQRLNHQLNLINKAS